MAAISSSALAEACAGFGAVLLVGSALTAGFQRLRQPRVVAEIVAGIVLGPSVLGLLPGHLPTRLFPQAAQNAISAIAEIAIMLFMFLVGWDMDLGQVRSRRGAVGAVALSSTALPLGAGIALALTLYHRHTVVAGHRVDEIGFVLFVGVALSITAFPVLARILVERRIQFTPEGTLALASAAVGDVLAWCLLAAVSLVVAGTGPTKAVHLVLWSACYVVVLALVVRPLLRVVVARLSGSGPASAYPLALLAAGAFFAGYVTQQIGLDAIFGAFSFGLVMPRHSHAELGRCVREPMENVTALLLPAFFVSAGFGVNLRGLGAGGLVELVEIVAVACGAKLIGAFGAARLSGMSRREAASVSLLMNTRGLTELIILNIGVSMGVLDGGMYTMMVIMAVITTGMAGPLLPRRAEPVFQQAMDLDEVALAGPVPAE